VAEAGQTLRAGCSLPCPGAAPVCCRRAAAAQPAPAIAYNADYAREWRALVSGRGCPLLRIIRPALYEGTGPPAIAGGGSLPCPGAAPVCALPLAAAARRRGRSAAYEGREARGVGCRGCCHGAAGAAELRRASQSRAPCSCLRPLVSLLAPLLLSPARRYDAGSTCRTGQPLTVRSSLAGSAARDSAGGRTPQRGSAYPRRSARRPAAEWCGGGPRGFPPGAKLSPGLP
jgi:hypothetical protein